MKIGKCHACEVLTEALASERRRVDELLDRIVTMKGHPEATREALAPAVDPKSPPPHHDDEGDDEPATEEQDLFAEAAEEMRRVAAERNVNPAAYADV